MYLFYSLSWGPLRATGDFLLTYIIPQTPLVVVLIMFTFVSAWAVRAGLEVIARISIIFVALTNVILISTVLLLLKDMKFTNFLPIFSIPLKDFIQGTHGGNAGDIVVDYGIYRCYIFGGSGLDPKKILARTFCFYAFLVSGFYTYSFANHRYQDPQSDESFYLLD